MSQLNGIREIIQDIPICLKAHTGNYMQNEFCTRNARCKNKNTLSLEQMRFLITDDHKLIIQSNWNNRNLKVRDTGKCVFANREEELPQKFEVGQGKDKTFYFTSCYNGNVLQCDMRGYTQCIHQVRHEWTAWRIVRPRRISYMTAGKLRNLFWTIAGGVSNALIGIDIGKIVLGILEAFGVDIGEDGTPHLPLPAVRENFTSQIRLCSVKKDFSPELRACSVSEARVLKSAEVDLSFWPKVDEGIGKEVEEKETEAVKEVEKVKKVKVVEKVREVEKVEKENILLAVEDGEEKEVETWDFDYDDVDGNEVDGAMALEDGTM